MAVGNSQLLHLEPGGFDRPITRWQGWVSCTGDGSGGYNSLDLLFSNAFMIGRNWQWCVDCIDISTDYTATATYADLVCYTGQWMRAGVQIIYQTNMGTLNGGTMLIQNGTYNNIPWLGKLFKPDPSIALLNIGVRGRVSNINTIVSYLHAQGRIFQEPITGLIP